MLEKGLFIVLDGLDGAGKTNQREVMKILFEELTHRRVIVTREPGGTPMAEVIRELLVHTKEVVRCDEPMHAMTELLLFMAGRNQHYNQLIKPRLDEGCVVICDRWMDVTYAYQGTSRGLGSDVVKVLEDMTLKGARPDLTFIFDVDPAVGIARRKGTNEVNRLDGEEAQFYEEARATFLSRAAKDMDRYRLVDTNNKTEGDVGVEVAMELIKLGHLPDTLTTKRYLEALGKVVAFPDFPPLVEIND